MKIKVEYHDGGESWGRYRLWIPCDGTICEDSVPGDAWTRQTAITALDICEYVYGLTRKNIRFVEVGSNNI